jgi:hypothetical protein
MILDDNYLQSCVYCSINININIYIYIILIYIYILY